MADNVTIPATGSGTATPVIATDDVGGVQYQRVKLDVGADGATTPVTAAAPLPVVQTGALPAGTAAIGKLAPNSGVDIGDVDVTSLPAITGTVTVGAALPAGANNIGDVDVLTLPGVAGDIANDAADSGNPVKVGGLGHAGPTAVSTDGDRVNQWFTKLGAAVVAADYDGTAGSDAVGAINSLPGRTNTTAGGGTVPLAAGLYSYNGTTWDRVRGNTTTGLFVGGSVAHDAADAGNPVKIGGKAADFQDTLPTDVAPDDRVNALFGLKGNMAVTLMSAAGVLDPTQNVVSTPTPANGATLANVSASVTSVALQAANSARRGLTIWNDSTSVLYIKFGTTASATSCTAKLVADAYYEVPGNYSGRVDGIWVSATGSARMTELEP